MAKYSLTPRVKMLAERLVSRNSSISTERATIFDSLDNNIAGVPQAIKPAQRFYQLFVIFQAISLKMSLLSVANPQHHVVRFSTAKKKCVVTLFIAF